MRAKLYLLGPAVGALLLSLNLTATAQAAEAGETRIQAGSCSSGNFCLFENNEYNEGNTNHWRDIVHNDDSFDGNHWRDGNGNLTDDEMEDETSSVKNRTGCTVRLFREREYKGDDWTGFSDGQDDPVLSNNRVGDNTASSARFIC